jgi:hypothetical protein
MGYAASGWDPDHAPDDQRLPADVVNLGFVLNVIEDPAERVEVLSSAWALARRLLVVATSNPRQEAYSNFQCFGDGVLTSRNTFQKYFEPAEIQSLIEDAIGCEAVPVAMGIYFVFRNVSEATGFPFGHERSGSSTGRHFLTGLAFVASCVRGPIPTTATKNSSTSSGKRLSISGVFREKMNSTALRMCELPAAHCPKRWRSSWSALAKKPSTQPAAGDEKTRWSM